jgi:hypothetical protein
MKRQRGITLSGVFFLMFLLGFAAYAAARVVPAYMDYWVVKRIMRNVLEQPDLANLKEGDLRLKFAKELNLNNVKVVSVDDLVIDPIPNGLRLSASYSVKEAFMGPVSLCMDFRAEVSSQ